METSENKPLPPTPVALGVLTAIVYLAGFTMVGAWFALVLIEQPRASPAALEAAACRICGVVERVGESRHGRLRAWLRCGLEPLFWQHGDHSLKRLSRVLGGEKLSAVRVLHRML